MKAIADKARPRQHWPPIGIINNRMTQLRENEDVIKVIQILFTE